MFRLYFWDLYFAILRLGLIFIVYFRACIVLVFAIVEKKIENRIVGLILV